MFGDGLNYNETFPSYFNKHSTHNYKTYNYALSGYGPTQNLIMSKRSTPI